MSLGAELRRARVRAGLTQEELSFRAEVDRSYISQLEHDLKSPTVDMLLRLCRAPAPRPPGSSPASRPVDPGRTTGRPGRSPFRPSPTLIGHECGAGSRGAG